LGGSSVFTQKEKEVAAMKKMILLGWLVLSLTPMAWGQEKVDAPVWNVGDKWTFNREGPVEVTGQDAQCYTVKFSGGIFRRDASGIALFERSNLNVKYRLEGNKRKKYTDLRKKILNFPLALGKQWSDLIQYDSQATTFNIHAVEVSETFRVLGWEEVEVPAGKFKAIKLEYKCEPKLRSGMGWITHDVSKALYWFSPEVKNFVKCQYEKGYTEPVDQLGKSESGKEERARTDWALVSYELKK
jgi:hypothetical protein